MSHITLYQFPTCPFCAKVRAKLDGKRMKYVKVDVSSDRESDQRKDLATKSGVMTVPVLGIDGKFIGESDVIIAYLDEHY